MAGSVGSIDGCGGRPARTCVSTNVTLANSTSMTTSSGPACTSATSAGSSTSGGPNSRITTARTPGLLCRNDCVRNEPKGPRRAAQRATVLGPSPHAALEPRTAIAKTLLHP